MSSNQVGSRKPENGRGDPHDARSASTSEVVLTGVRQHGKVEVWIRGEPVLLPRKLLRAFLDLVLARLATHSGCSRIPSVFEDDPEATQDDTRKVIYRLRKKISASLGVRDAGLSLVIQAMAGEYYLSITSERIFVHPSFFELPSELAKVDDIDLVKSRCKLVESVPTPGT